MNESLPEIFAFTRNMYMEVYSEPFGCLTVDSFLPFDKMAWISPEGSVSIDSGGGRIAMRGRYNKPIDL